MLRKVALEGHPPLHNIQKHQSPTGEIPNPLIELALRVQLSGVPPALRAPGCLPPDPLYTRGRKASWAGRQEKLPLHPRKQHKLQKRPLYLFDGTQAQQDAGEMPKTAVF